MSQSPDPNAFHSDEPTTPVAYFGQPTQGSAYQWGDNDKESDDEPGLLSDISHRLNVTTTQQELFAATMHETNSDRALQLVADTQSQQGLLAQALKIQRSLTGNRLNQMDSQLVKDHLERYLPTPATRFQMMRERIHAEVTQLRHDIMEYQKLPGSDYTTKKDAMEDRLALLEQQLKMLDIKVAEINPFLNIMQKVQKLQTQITGPAQARPSKPKSWFKNPDPYCQALTEANDHLDSLHRLLESHLNNPNFSPNQLGRLINEYETQTKMIDQIADMIRNRRGFRDKLNDKVNALFRKLYSA